MGTFTPSTKLQVKHGSTPDESRPFAAHGHADIHQIGNGTVMRAVFEPGWKWSHDVAPLTGTKSCQAPHLGYCLTGRMKIRMDDGDEQEVGPGDFYRCAPGHDAWVIGSEACIMLDFAGYADYAKPAIAPGRSEARSAPTERERHSHSRLDRR
jgi:quercetin dioxygenase-like cupin family protein